MIPLWLLCGEVEGFGLFYLPYLCSIDEMNRLPILLCLLLGFGFQAFAGETVDLSLTDGSRIKGQVMSVLPNEVTVMTDFGVLRIDQATRRYISDRRIGLALHASDDTRSGTAPPSV